MKKMISYWMLALTVASSLTAFFVARAFSVNLELVVFAVTAVTLIVAIVIERWMPFDPHWNSGNGDFKTDATSTVVLLGVVDPLLKAFAPLLVVLAYSNIATRETFTLFPVDALFLAQLLVATLLIEFGRYWAHRWHHTNRILWWLHAMHHSSERLYAVNNFRFHPLNYGVNFALSTFPLMLIGVPADVLFGYMALTQPVLMLQHANIDLRSGWLNYVFSTNELHRWHHSSDTTEANSNYGSALVVWDQVFGTFRLPRAIQSPKRIGLFEQSASYPARASYLQQLLSAFGPPCCRA